MEASPLFEKLKLSEKKKKAGRETPGALGREGVVTRRLKVSCYQLHATQTWFSHLDAISREFRDQATHNLHGDVALNIKTICGENEPYPRYRAGEIGTSAGRQCVPRATQR